ncbi:MAG: hypothetical protein ACTSUQ_13750 [Candidatus Freyarchaeota archaeon]
MDGVGVLVAVAFSLFYPLIIWFLVKRVRFGDESYRYLFAAFLLGAVMFYLAYLRKLYALFLGGVALYGVDLIATGFVEEAAKLLVLLIPFIRARLDERNGAFFGLVVGLGFGGGEAVLLLSTAAVAYSLNQLFLLIDLLALSTIASMALSPMETLFLGLYIVPQLLSEVSEILSVVLGPSLVGIPLISVYERAIVILFHATLAAIIGYGLVRGKTLKYYLTAVAVHIFLDVFAVLYAFGVLGVMPVEAILTVISVALFVYVMLKTVLPAEKLKGKL